MADEQRPLNDVPLTPAGEEERPEIDPTAAAKAAITVFHDKDNFTVKHPLMSKWTLWFTKPPSSKGESNWADSLKEVVTFDSVEEFWGIYNNIQKTSELALKSDYHLFRERIRPEWEDRQNKNGGRWSYQYKNKKDTIDDIWLNVMLAAIGETLEKEGDNEVMGVVVNVRNKFFRVSLWTRTTGGVIRASGSNKGRTAEQGRKTLLEIGRNFKQVLGLKEEEMLEFSGHTESSLSGSSRAKAKFSV